MNFGTLFVRPAALQATDAQRLFGATPPDEIIAAAPDDLLWGEGIFISWRERTAIQHTGNVWWRENSPAIIDLQVMISRIYETDGRVVLGVVTPYSSLSSVILASINGGKMPDQEFQVDLSQLIQFPPKVGLLSFTAISDGREDSCNVHEDINLWAAARERLFSSEFTKLSMQTEASIFTVSNRFDLTLQEYPNELDDLATELQVIGALISGSVTVRG